MQLGLGAAALGAAFGWPLDVARRSGRRPCPPRPNSKRRRRRPSCAASRIRSARPTSSVARSRRRWSRSAPTGRRLSAALIETTAKVQDAEREVAAADDRLTSLNAKADSLSRSLDSRREAIAEVLAALQRMGTNPPPAILVKPQDMAEAVRAASLLGSVIPDLKSETEALARDIDDLSKTRESIAQRARRPGATARLSGARERRACPRSSTRARSRCPRPRRRSAHSNSARPISPGRRLRSRI